MTLSSTWEAQCINKCILLSSKCGSQFGHAPLAGATSSLLFWRKGSGHSLWWHPQEIYGPAEDLQERKTKIKLDGPEWIESRVVTCTHRLRVLCQKETLCHFTSSFLYSLVSCFFYSKFLFPVPWGTNQISRDTGSNSVAMHKMGVRMSKFS